MASTRTILRNLRNLREYLDQFHPTHQSAYFELLVAEAFSHILNLPYFAIDNENTSILNRVTWLGRNQPISKAPGGNPDVLAYCYNFYLIIEATKNTGANQWTREFAPSFRHCDEFIRQSRIQPTDVYIILVATQLHQDTYLSLQANPRHEYCFIPIEVSDLLNILKTSSLAPSMRHLELRRLLNKIGKYIRIAVSLDDFRDGVNKLIREWQKEVLSVEKRVFLGIRAYRAMKAIQQTGRIDVSISELFTRLFRDPIVKSYFKIIEGKPQIQDIETIICEESCAVLVGHRLNNEPLFEPVPFADFKARCIRLIETIEKIGK